MEELDSGDAENLALLTRPELGVTFSKLHAWRLTQYSKCVFLDADALVLQNVDELFDREELSAAPDIGWPDCFNSGVFVFEPSLETFRNLLDLARQGGSFDGELCICAACQNPLKSRRKTFVSEYVILQAMKQPGRCSLCCSVCCSTIDPLPRHKRRY